ncbi:hypothetical protein OE88DRAFT_1652055 [Heliocybe sulcata]|uniref:Uncharacterized protein n=1 Tax=Heliocybe sulcata TaxID=5364 RepID=A0A5C3NFE9_9AGAM|nr:hypothetical protein OE88DRAFT_1652055 [Heliocybe sulcata]
MSASEVMDEHEHPPPLSRAGSTPKPKGILKNAPHPPASPQQGPRLFARIHECWSVLISRQAAMG